MQFEWLISETKNITIKIAKKINEQITKYNKTLLRPIGGHKSVNR